MAERLEVEITAKDELTPALEKNAKAIDEVKSKSEELVAAKQHLNAKLEELAKNVNYASVETSSLGDLQGVLQTQIGGTVSSFLSWGAVLSATVKVIKTYRDAEEDAAKDDLRTALDAVAQQAEVTAMRIAHLTDMLNRFVKSRDAMQNEKWRSMDATDATDKKIRQIELRERLATANTPEERYEIQRQFDESEYATGKDRLTRKYNRRLLQNSQQQGDVRERLGILDQQDAARRKRMEQLVYIRDYANGNIEHDKNGAEKYAMAVKSLFNDVDMKGDSDFENIAKEAEKRIAQEQKSRRDVTGERQDLKERQKLLEKQRRDIEREKLADLELLKTQHEHDRAEKDRAEQARKDKAILDEKAKEEAILKEANRNADNWRKERDRAEKQRLDAMQKQAREAQRDANGRVRAAGAALGGANDALAAFNESWRKRGTREWRDAKKEEREAEKEARKQERRDAADRKRYDDNIKRIRRKAYFGGKFALSSGERELLANDTAMRKEKKRLEDEQNKAAADLKQAEQDARAADKAAIEIAETLKNAKEGNSIRVTSLDGARP